MTDEVIRALVMVVQEDDRWEACMVTDAYHPSEPGIRIIAIDGFTHEVATVFRFPEDEAFVWAEDFIANNKLPFKGVRETHVTAPPTDSVTTMDRWASVVIGTALRDLFGVNVSDTRVAPPGGW